VSQESTNRSFDDLARALAEGSISRRRALKLFAGTAFASLIPSRVLADDCVKICHIPFDDGRCRLRRAETRCVSPERAEFHLKNHRCDCLGSCASTDKCRATTSTTTSTTSTTATPSTTTSTPCLPNGGTCSTGGTPCCSGNCVGGTCAAAPSTTPNAITCQCANDTLTSCSSRECSQAVEFCAFACLDFGGVLTVQCFPNDPSCA
jgi:hypothetical protein